MKNKIKYFIICPGINCKTNQELFKRIRTKAQLCSGCKRALVYTIGKDPLLPGVIMETVFKGQIEVVTYGAARAPRRTRARR